MKQLFILLLTIVLQAAPWDFGAPQHLLKESGDSIFSVKGFISPQVLDYDGDGLLDLFLGTFEDCNMHLYINNGSNKNPVINEKILIMGDVGWPLFDKTGW